MSLTLDNQLKELIVERLFLDVVPSEIDSNAPLSTYGVDSFLMLELIVAIEEAFQVHFEQEDITAEALRTIGALAELVSKKQNP